MESPQNSIYDSLATGNKSNSRNEDKDRAVPSSIQYLYAKVRKNLLTVPSSDGILTIVSTTHSKLKQN